MTDVDEFGVDLEHPIPDLNLVDVHTVLVTGGSDLFIVVAQRLHGDPRSLRRLLRKIENYLGFVASEQFALLSSPATVDNTRLVVKLPSDSDPRVFELLHRNRQWIANNNATLVVDVDSLSLH